MRSLFTYSSSGHTDDYFVREVLLKNGHLNFILFFGPFIFNNEDKKINQKHAQINSGLIYY